MNPVYIGTSGFSYKSWGNTFYPEEVPKYRQLEFYQTQFPTVEINATFYRLATLAMTRRWHDVAPEGFLYAIKGSRFITHIKRLKDVEEALDTFFKRIAPLKEKTGSILWQLPPTFQKDCVRLGDFLRLLPKNYRHAVEFRHVSWFEDDEVLKLLKKYRAAFVSVSSGRMPMNFSVTTDFIYIRFHGLAGGAAHDYTRAELQPWADHILAHRDKTAFIYFNNDVNVRAPQNARELMGMIGERALGPFATEMHFPPPKRGVKPKRTRRVAAGKRQKRVAIKDEPLNHNWAEAG
ncbi:MAG TPA: DUF72 domain-containing protein [Verrucomicrobiae bacterium]|nr:DUF72 domain-containing protein [Verrucomicrobiae bacterium]